MTIAPEPIRVERPASGGAVGHLPDGRVVFIRHTAPSELVTVDVTDETSKVCRGDAIEIIEASPERVTAPCAYAHVGGCGGCDFQHVSSALVEGHDCGRSAAPFGRHYLGG